MAGLGGESQMIKLGIGITTFRRSRLLALALDGIARHTRAPYSLIVADDGSQDETLDLLRSRKIAHIAGPNRGIAWNKNRVLFHLHEVVRCDVVILLEDDMMPRHDGWEADWIEAIQKWGHANIAGNWFEHLLGSEAGTPDDPFVSTVLTAQCSGFARKALSTVGYMDTRFGRYGHEHVEHTTRLVRAGFGGVNDPERRFFLLKSDLQMLATDHAEYHDELDKNAAILAEVNKDPTLYRRPWRTPEEWQRIRSDLKHTVAYEPHHRAQVLAARVRAAIPGGRGFKRFASADTSRQHDRP